MLALKIYERIDKRWFWVLYGKNGKSVCQSINNFNTKQLAITSADNFERNCLRFGTKKNY